MDPHDLHQTWRHSHEEDQDGALVFRPAAHTFPPSRGRYGFTLIEGGRMESLGPSRSDRDQHLGGRWSIEKENTLALHESGTPPRRFFIEDVAPDRLVLRPLD